MHQARTEELIFVEDSPEGGYEARALGHSIFTAAPDLDRLHEMARDAVDCHFDADDRPRIVRLHFVRDEILAV